MKNVLIIGATSAIAQEFALRIGTSGAKLFLVARDKSKLLSIKKDIEVRNNTIIDTFILDVNDHKKINQMFTKAKLFLGQLDCVLIAHGTLPDQEKCNDDIKLAIQEFNTNATSTIALCQSAANILEEQKLGNLAVITSVAGDRGRQSNYIYGAAKGAIITYLQGLRNRLTKVNVSVLTIKPGFVDTPMTASIPKTPLFSSPEKIARGIAKAINKNKSIEIYLPSYWRIIMTIIKTIPSKIFNRLYL